MAPIKITPNDPLECFTDTRGWFYYIAFNLWIESNGFGVTQGDKHGCTYGGVHYEYTHLGTGESLNFNGNCRDAQSFIPVIEWAKPFINQTRQAPLA